MSDESKLSGNLRRVQDMIAEACHRAGRRPDSVTLVAVTKYVDTETAKLLASAGCRELGESRPQELVRKAQALSDLAIRWNLVGHLQRNKIKQVIPYCALVHSVDSVRLLEAVDACCVKLGLVCDVLIEVNISGESVKTGAQPSETPALFERAAELASVRVRGLMGMAALDVSHAEIQRQFASLRQLRDELVERWPHHPLPELSMGMSGDFPQAIAEGATLVRIGSLLFE